MPPWEKIEGKTNYRRQLKWNKQQNESNKNHAGNDNDGATNSKPNNQSNERNPEAV